MKQPKYTDRQRGRYRTASESREPGYLAKRLKAYARLQRMRESRSANVTPLPAKKVANER